MKICSLILITLSISIKAQNPFSSIIPQDRIIGWSNSGLQILRPVFYDHIIDVCTDFNVRPTNNKTVNTQGLLNAIESARTLNGWKCIFFSQTGTYNFGSTINLTNLYSYLVFKGIGSSSVILYFEIGGFASDMFRLSGSLDDEITTLNPSYYYNKGDNIIHLSQQRTDIEDDNWIKLWDDRLVEPSWAKVGQVLQINTNSNGDALLLKDQLSISYPNTVNRYIQKFEPIKNIGFEDLTIKRAGSDGTFHNGLSASIRFNFAVNCWVYGVESWGTMGWHFGFEKSSHIWLNGNFIHHANNYAGGNAYGVCLHDRSTNCLVENNVFNYLRHSILTQSSATKNVISYNYSYDRYCTDCDLFDGSGDISIHGTLSNSNLFEGNTIEYIYADDSHGSNGYYNTIFRNIVKDGYSLNDIDLESIDYVNLVGNICDDVEFNSSNFQIDAFGRLSGGQLVSHYMYFLLKSTFEPIVYCTEPSYYLSAHPTWLSSTFSWPPIGPRLSLSSPFLTQSNPAYSRHLSGVKKTLNGPPVKTKIKLNPGYYPETNSYGGSYKINGNNTTTWYPLFNEQVTIQAFPQNSGEVFYKWSDGSTSNPRTIQIKNSLNVNAFFKYPNKSSNVNGYDKDGQRKVINSIGTYDGGIWKVYESSGNVWLEKDGVVVNGGVPVNILSDGPEAKSPSMDYVISSTWYTDIFVVYQQKTTNDKYKIKLAKFDGSGQKIYTDDVITSTIDYSVFDATPVISVTRNPDQANGKTKFNIVWRQKAEGSYQNGLYFYPGMDNGTNITWYYLPPAKINSTDIQSSNPTMAAFKSPQGVAAFLYHLAWQQGTSKINYRAIADNLEWGGVLLNVFNNAYNTSAPFAFQNYYLTNDLNKTNNFISKEGRFGTIMKNDAEFYFGMGDVTSDNDLINFVAVNDTIELAEKELLNSCLITEPFEVNDNSNLTYSIIYGVKDSSVAIGTLSNSDNISFKVELIDNVSNTVLSVFDQVVQSKNSIVAYENLSYQVNTAGIGNRTVRIRLVVDPNFMDAKFSLSKIFSDGAPLSKSKFNEVNWRGLNTVDSYNLSQNYPNPFNPSTTIKFQLPTDGFVTLKIYDILGNEITTLINEQKTQGRYEVNFSATGGASSLASGVYIYTIQVNNFFDSKKMILIK